MYHYSYTIRLTIATHDLMRDTVPLNFSLNCSSRFANIWNSFVKFISIYVSITRTGFCAFSNNIRNTSVDNHVPLLKTVSQWKQKEITAHCRSALCCISAIFYTARFYRSDEFNHKTYFVQAACNFYSTDRYTVAPVMPDSKSGSIW